MIRGLIEREGRGGSYALTDQGRAVLAALLGGTLMRLAGRHGWSAFGG
jgi:DNA-binding PadR family transcriptional regulator